MKRRTAIATAALLASPLAASAAPVQVAPFTSPQTITIPGNFPSGGIKPGVYRRSDSLSFASLESVGRTHERFDVYIGQVRRRGNIVSFYSINRTLEKPSAKFNQSNASENYLKAGTFLPQYYVRLQRYDCANDSYMSVETPISIITAAGGHKGWEMPTDRSKTKFIPIPNQVRISIEGYPYWASHDNNDWTTAYPRDKPEWVKVIPGTNGAAFLDAACDSKL